MSFLAAALLLTEFPGSLIYHLILGMSLAVVLSIAQVYRTATQNLEAKRWFIAAGSLLIIRIIMMSISTLSWLDVIQGDVLVPMLDRLTSMMGISIIAWGFQIPNRSLTSIRTFLSTGLVAGILGLIITSIVFLNQAPLVSFNHSSVDAFWSIASLFLTLAAMSTLFFYRPTNWDTIIIPFGLIAVGYATHISFGPTSADLAGFVRMLELSAYPLIAIIASKRIAEVQLGFVSDHALFSSNVLKELPDDRADLETIIGLLSAEENYSDLARAAVESISLRLHCDLCLLFSAPDQLENMSLITGFDLRRKKEIRGSKIGGSLPKIAHAISLGKPFALQESKFFSDTESLVQLTGARFVGPLVFQPLVEAGDPIGGLLMLFPLEKQSFSLEDKETIEVLSSFISTRFSHFKHHKDASIEGETDDPSVPWVQILRVEALEKENENLKILIEKLRTRNGPERNLEPNPANLDEPEIMNLEQSEDGSLREVPPFQEPQTDEQKFIAAELQFTLKELAEARDSFDQTVSGIDEDALHSNGNGELIDSILAVAQDLRQPMSSVLSYTDLLLGESVGLFGAMQRKFLERTRGAVDRMGDLLTEMGQITSKETNVLDINPGPVDFIHCLESAIGEKSEELITKSIVLRMDIPEVLPPILGNQESIIEIVDHLLANAITVTPEEDEIFIRTIVKDEDEEHFLIVSVGDAGDGIASEDLGKVFQRSYNTRSSPISGVGDSGLGLSMVKSLSEMIGGRVWVSSTLGEGSTFSVLFPVVKTVLEAPVN
jgi:signal transduction histidine kinase